ncbi:MAG TPA: hypothetical protein VIG64_13380 [Actinomycetota bacterium]|jgi:hypothetical protein
MSERSRRRRRRRRGSGGGAGSDPQRRAERETPQGQPVAREEASSVGRPRRRRRGRSRSGQDGIGSPKSSEDLVRALPRERPATLTAPPDGQTLETLIGDLQSEYGVPQYPQEYRITLKVADDKERGERPVADDAATPAPPGAPTNGGPRREKAPAMKSSGSPGEAPREQARGAAPRKRSRRRRRRRGSGGGGGPSGGAPPG